MKKLVKEHGFFFINSKQVYSERLNRALNAWRFVNDLAVGDKFRFRILEDSKNPGTYKCDAVFIEFGKEGARWVSTGVITKGHDTPEDCFLAFLEEYDGG